MPDICPRCKRPLPLCKRCGRDISDRDPRATYCKACSNTLKSQRYRAKKKGAAK